MLTHFIAIDRIGLDTKDHNIEKVACTNNPVVPTCIAEALDTLMLPTRKRLIEQHRINITHDGLVAVTVP